MIKLLNLELNNLALTRKTLRPVPIFSQIGEALSDANGLASGSCGLSDGSSAGDWRLPNIRELQSLIHYGFYDPALPDTAGTGQWREDDPFTNVQLDDYYWSNTTYAVPRQDNAWLVGNVAVVNKAHTYHVWPVRGGS